MADGISEGEFVRAIALLRDDMNRGFGGVHGRLDVLNGKTQRHGEAIAVLQAEGVSTGPSRKAIAGYASAAGTGVVAIVEVVKAVVAAVKG